jgi:hypothetical protein
MKPSYMQPALFGGLVIGVLSALPIISAGNLCCCLWVISGGLVAAYSYQQRLETPITPGDGALAGLLAGIVGAVVYLVLSIPINLLIGPWERVLIDRFREGMPPDFREFVASRAGGGLFVVFGFVIMLFVGSIFATIGGLLGSIFFKKSTSHAAIDVTATPPSDVTPPSA